MNQSHFPRLPLVTMVAALLGGLTLGACGQMDAGIERTATPDIPASATAASIETERASLATRVVELEPGAAALGAGSVAGEIEAKLAQSAQTWRRVWADIEVTYYPPEGSSEGLQQYRHQVWVDQPGGKFREIFGPRDGEPTHLRVADGTGLLEMDLVTGEARRSDLPGFELPPEPPGDAVVMEPMRMALGPATGDLIFPGGLAQRGGTYAAVDLDTVAGRDSLVVDWSREGAGRVDRFWIDVQTGLILRWQHFGKQGGETMESEHIVEKIAYDITFPPGVFILSPTTVPRFSDANGNPVDAPATVPFENQDQDPEGEVYFFIMDQGYPAPAVELVRLPGSCATGRRACPEPEIVPIPFNLQFTLTPLVWSPEGNLAAFAYPVQEDGNRAGLHLYDPGADSWTTVAEFPFIDPPVWSPDGEWITFRVQDGEGGEAIYAIRPDGSDLRNLSVQYLPQEDSPYLLDGWLGEEALLRPQGPNGGLGPGVVFALDIDKERSRELASGWLENAALFPAPDGERVAAVGYGERAIALRLLDSQGNLVQEIATFQGGGLFPVIWSSGGQQLVFGHESMPDDGPGHDLYLAGISGGGLDQVYSGTWVEAAVFSPGGDFLLIGADSPVGEHLYVVSLASLEQRLLRAPGLSLAKSWLAPSWQPARDS